MPGKKTSSVEERRDDLLDAKTAVLRAEAAKLEAEALTAKLGAERAAVEIQKLAAETRAAACTADQAAINLERERRKEVEMMADNKYHHVYHFTNQVNGGSVQACMERLAYWSRTEPGCAIELIFTSPGGSVIDGMALFDFIQQLRRAGHFITTRALGWAASMAGILLQAGDKRVMAKESYVLIHEISTGAVGKIGEIEDEVKFVKKIQGRILDIFAARANVKREYFAKHWKRQDWWLDSDEALKIGIIDEVG
jgi:ATP-dependent Clp protease protease subunit